MAEKLKEATARGINAGNHILCILKSLLAILLAVVGWVAANPLLTLAIVAVVCLLKGVVFTGAVTWAAYGLLALALHVSSKV